MTFLCFLKISEMQHSVPCPVGNFSVESFYFLRDKLLKFFLRNQEFVFGHAYRFCETFKCEFNLNVVFLSI